MTQIMQCTNFVITIIIVVAFNKCREKCFTCPAFCMVLPRHYLTRSSQKPREIVVILIFPILNKEKTKAFNQQRIWWTVELEVHMQENLVITICISVFGKSLNSSCSCKCIKNSHQTYLATVDQGFWLLHDPTPWHHRHCQQSSHSDSGLPSRFPLEVSMRTQPPPLSVSLCWWESYSLYWQL